MAISLINHGTANATALGDFTSSAFDLSGATFVVVALSWYDGGITLDATLTNSESDTYTGLTKRTSGDHCVSRFYYCKAPTATSGYTFTVTGPAVGGSICWAAFTGIDTSSPFDQENGATNGFATSLATGSVTPGVDNEIVFAMSSIFNNPGTRTIDNGFTIIDDTGDGTGNFVTGALAYKIQTAASAVNPTWSWSNINTTSAAIASFKAGAVAAATQGGLLLTGVG